MKTIGTIMYVLGILMAVFTGLMLLIFLVIPLSEPETFGVGETVTVLFTLGIFLGGPTFLLIFFGRKLARRNGANAVAGTQPYQQQHQQSYSHKQTHTQTEVTVRYLSDDGSGNAGAALAGGGAAAASGMAEKLVQCTNCGAHKTLQPRQSAACEYCGTVLNY